MALCARCAPRFLTFVTLGLLLASCAGGGGTGPLPSQDGAGSPSTTTQSERLYVASGNVLAFDASASGNVAPLFTINGIPGCSFPAVTGVAVDASGKVFASNPGYPVAYPQIDIYTVSTALVPTFVGAITGDIQSPWQIAVDSQDHVYVANQEGSISIYAPGPTGVKGAFAVIKGPHTGLYALHGVAVDAAGDIFASNSAADISGVLVPGNILEFAPGSNGDVAPIRRIAGANTQLNSPFGIAVDSAGNLYASGAIDGGISVYAKGANGNAAPMALISGANTTLRASISVAVGSTGKIYVTDFGPVGGADADVAVFAPGANGNVAPIAVIHGPATGFKGATNIAVR